MQYMFLIDSAHEIIHASYRNVTGSCVKWFDNMHHLFIGSGKRRLQDLDYEESPLNDRENTLAIYLA